MIRMNRRDCENLGKIRGWLFAWVARDRKTPYKCGYRDGVNAMIKASEKLKSGPLTPDDIGRLLSKRLAKEETISGKEE